VSNKPKAETGSGKTGLKSSVVVGWDLIGKRRFVDMVEKVSWPYEICEEYRVMRVKSNNIDGGGMIELNIGSSGELG
jgi:hypothetical protein